MLIKAFVFNPFAENTYLLYDENLDAIIIDPGCYEKYEQDEIMSFIKDNQLVPKCVINTHCHIDHVLGNAFFTDQFNIPLWIPKGEKQILDAMPVYAPNWGITNYQHAEPTHYFDQTAEIEVGKESLQCLFAPGHSPGHMMFYHTGQKFLIAGDVIFNQSIGRTDLPGGDYDTLEKSIREQVYTLPEETEIYPGHGPKTTVGFEKKHNPFVTA
jgi:glyoxylase-like metal-dependent hydrolase (beta-lactamase superfamily II)